MSHDSDMIPGCSTRHCVHTVVLVILLCVVGRGADAQQEDILLSGDPTEMVLPAQIRIQAAGRIDDRTLAVWGSSIADSNGGVRSVFYMQLFDGATAVGPPRILTGSDAEPSGFVQVLPIENRFLVVWNGRDAQGMAGYLQQVDREGIASAPDRISESAILAPGLFSIGSRRGDLLLWSDSTASVQIHAILLSNAGSLEGESMPIDTGRILGVMKPEWSSSRSIIERHSLPPILVDSNGENVPLPDPGSTRFAHPYHIGADGSLITSSRRGLVQVYRSIEDSLPERTIQFPIQGGAWEYAIPSLDSIGRVQLVVGYLLTAGFQTIWYLKIRKVVEIAPMQFGAPEEIFDTEAVYFPGFYSVNAYISAASMKRACGNRYTVDWFITADYAYDRGGYKGSGSHKYQRTTSLDEAGRLVETAGQSGCGLPASPPIIRQFDKHASAVVLFAGGLLHRLSAPAAIVTIDVPDRTPAIMAVREGIVFAYHRLALDSAMMLGHWKRDGKLVAIDSVDIDRESNLPTGRPGMRKRQRLLDGGNVFLLDVGSRWREPIDSVKSVDSQRCTIYLPTPQGWKQALRKSSSNEAPDRIYTSHAVARDQVSGSVVVALATVNSEDAFYSGLSIVGFDSNGARQWLVDTVRLQAQRPGLGLLPISPLNYSLFTASGIHRFDGESRVWEKAIEVPDGAHYLPLSEGGMLRWVWVYGYKGVGLELFDSTGELLVRSTAPVPERSFHPSIVYNPGSSGFVLLAGGPSGLFALEIDSELRAIRTARRISATTDSVFYPVGAIADGRLYAAWEDHRDATADIYGTSVPLNEISGIDEASRAPEEIDLRIHPNPASDRIVATWSGSGAAGSHLQLNDMLGRTVAILNIEPGAARAEISTAALPNGLYLLRLTEGTTVTTRTVHLSR